MLDTLGGLGASALHLGAKGIGSWAGNRWEKQRSEERKKLEDAETARLAVGAHKEPTPQEMRQLAARLFPYISQRLKAEIGKDRERAGMITGLHR